jgi:hypothetical protein
MISGMNEKNKYEWRGWDLGKIYEKIHSKRIAQHSIGETEENHESSQ